MPGSPDSGEQVHPWLVVPAIALQAIPVAYNLLAFDPPNVGADAALFQYSGLAARAGRLPYRHVWDVKPPLVHEVAAGLAVLAGGDPVRLHYASVVLTAAAIAGAVLLLALLAVDLTGARVAGYAAVGVLATYPTLYTLSSRGLRPKAFVLLFGLGGLWAFRRGRPAVAGAGAAVAAGFWQLAAVFPVLVAGGYARERDWRALARAGGGMAVVAVAVVWPFVARGTLDALVAEVLLAPLLAGEGVALPGRLVEIALVAKVAGVLALVGGVGVVVAGRRDGGGWLLAGAGWWAVQVLALDFDGAPDLLPGLAFAAVGVGVLVAEADAVAARRVLVALAVASAAMLGWAAHDGRLGPRPGAGLDDPDSLRAAYWDGRLPEDCHVRLSPVERQVIEATGASPGDAVCGQYPTWSWPAWLSGTASGGGGG